MSVYVYKEECLHNGIDPKAVERVAKRLSNAIKDANKLGLILFGGSGTADLRTYNQTPDGRHRYICAQIDGSVDGGDGGTLEDENGLMISE